MREEQSCKKFGDFCFDLIFLLFFIFFNFVKIKRKKIDSVRSSLLLEKEKEFVFAFEEFKKLNDSSSF